MKRFVCLLLSLLTLGGLTACAGQTTEATEETVLSAAAPAETAPLPTQPPETTEPEEETTVPTEEATQPVNPSGGFVDLTTLSSTMVYAEVFAMTSSPEEYVGKTIKMRGMFSKGQLYAADGSLADGGTVFACIIQDATACCAQGIPFDLAGDYEYPQDYPELGAEITVEGTFEIHEQSGVEFCRLRDAAFV